MVGCDIVKYFVVQSKGRKLPIQKDKCVITTLSPLRGLFRSHSYPTACAVGCILTPLRG